MSPDCTEMSRTEAANAIPNAMDKSWQLAPEIGVL